MRTIIIIICGLLTLAMAQSGGAWKAPPEADRLKDPMAGDRKAAAIGARIYTSLCWSCHGMEGRGDGPITAALMVRPADLGSPEVQAQSNGAIYWKITHGRGEMIAYEHALSREERWALVHHIRNLVHP
jgi:mono/diheme cytochrome c family protein